MIDSVNLNNFRGFKDITVPLSQVTMLTGINGAGKTTVLEALYCLFSETRLDVSYLARYYRTTGIFSSQFNGISNIANRPYFNYRLFWEECAMFNERPCAVSAKSSDGTTWKWLYLKGKTPNLGKNLIRDASLMGIPLDSTTDVVYYPRFSGK